MRILVTGADGFIGRNLRVRLRELGYAEIDCVTRATSAAALAAAIARSEFVFHLAGVNRPPDESGFHTGNVDFTVQLCELLGATGRKIPVAYSSSTQAERDNAYGQSKRTAERVLQSYATSIDAPLWLFRLPNVFGKWSRPNYNSAVATFCHQLARNLPIEIHDPAAPLSLIYIDDLVAAFCRLIGERPPAGFVEAGPVYATTVGGVAELLGSFASSRTSLVTARVGGGLARALYATFVSFLPKESFAYQVPRYVDPRGVFVEMLKTPDCGQFSYFTAHPGVARGEHYHHTKTEKFLVIQGTANFGFRNIDSGDTYELTVSGGEGHIVESIPGWTHNVVNSGETELIIMLWASEVFDRGRPDTIAMKVRP